MKIQPEKIPFKEVPLGARIIFCGHSLQTIYTRVEPDGTFCPDFDSTELVSNQQRTLVYTENGIVKNAYCNPDSEALVQIIN